MSVGEAERMMNEARQRFRLAAEHIPNVTARAAALKLADGLDARAETVLGGAERGRQSS
jgi:hypothetical protein